MIKIANLALIIAITLAGRADASQNGSDGVFVARCNFDQVGIRKTENPKPYMDKMRDLVLSDEWDGNRPIWLKFNLQKFEGGKGASEALEILQKGQFLAGLVDEVTWVSDRETKGQDINVEFGRVKVGRVGTLSLQEFPSSVKNRNTGAIGFGFMAFYGRSKDPSLPDSFHAGSCFGYAMDRVSGEAFLKKNWEATVK